MENLHDFVVRRLNEIGRSEWKSVAAATDVSIHTIIKIATREIVSPRYDKLDPLAQHLRERPDPRPSMPQAQQAAAQLGKAQMS
jgi:hypothetical protein